VCEGVPTIIYNSHFRGGDFDKQTKTGARVSSDWEVEDPKLVNWTR